MRFHWEPFRDDDDQPAWLLKDAGGESTTPSYAVRKLRTVWEVSVTWWTNQVGLFATMEEAKAFAEVAATVGLKWEKDDDHKT